MRDGALARKNYAKGEAASLQRSQISKDLLGIVTANYSRLVFPFSQYRTYTHLLAYKRYDQTGNNGQSQADPGKRTE
jgi:hypothetical protein